MKELTREDILKLKGGLELFNSQHYWECHEALEDVWREENRTPLYYISWLIIQVAAALVHYEKRNLIGLKTLTLRAQEKLSKITLLKLENNILKEMINWNEFIELVNKIPSESTYTDLDELFNFRFIMNGF